MKATISQIFDYFPGNHGLTEEIIYDFQPTSERDRIPIFSGSKDNIVPIDFICANAKNNEGQEIEYFQGPCLILTKDGSAGLLTYKERGMFTLNHHACVLKVKETWKDKLDQEWFAYQYKERLLQYVTSKSDNRVFSTEWFDRILFEIPDYPIQVDLRNKKKKLSILQNHLAGLKLNLEKITRGIVPSIKGEMAGLSKIFDFRGGNGGLTEEFIYSNQPNDVDKKIPILSSATLKVNMMGYVSVEAKPNGKKLKIFLGPCILVARNGYAGTMTYIEKGKFATNDHAYILTPKKKWFKKINLRWFVHQYQELFYNLVTSKSDNATFNKEYAEKQRVMMPSINIQNRIAEKLLKIDNLVENMEKTEEQIKMLLGCEVQSA